MRFRIGVLLGMSWLLCTGIGFVRAGEALVTDPAQSIPWAEISSERVQNWWDHNPHNPDPPLPERIAGLFADHAERTHPYERAHTFFTINTLYTPDPFVWSYTAAFAKRFRMPEQWIDPDLDGALGLAFRMREPTVFRCGLNGDEDRCDTRKICELDLYYDNRIVLPWNTPHIRRDNLMQGVHSGLFLYDPEYKYRSLNHHFYKRNPDGTQQMGPLASGGQLYVNGQPISSPGEVAHFDQAFAPALGLISWHGVCPKPTESGPVTLPFFDASGALMHQVTIPRRWMQEVYALWKKEHAVPAHMPQKPRWEQDRLGRMLTLWWNRAFDPRPVSDGPPIDDEPYQKNFTFRDRKPFIRDTWIWAYTREFAERFHMPEEWIEPDLKGALAVAYRMTPLGRRSCGAAAVEDLCDPTLYVQKDIYYDTATTPLPWIYADTRHDNRIYLMTSASLLKGPEVHGYISLNRFFYNGMGRKDPHFRERFKGDLWRGTGIFHSYGDPVFFDRDYRPGLGRFVSCIALKSRPGCGNAFISFMKPMPPNTGP
ncbi:hypothetical protein HEQ72_10870 [Haematospirillum sp. 15-248]|uniref:hypothetical protein n=1 Tax=Haematospirillum sp. 15-248 TaxID=2723107 RepID=UPI00143A79FB|nr:hypothetical protein [Haematospirillum sp. 15-248]NKD88801.1 hypothetical protein [Haematospirillum sp. 15-248]